MRVYIDQLNRQIELKKPPVRIISLVPSQTELLYELGLEAEVVGITKFCVHPETWFRNKTRIGGTKNINIEKIKSLSPDLIIANKEENIREQILALEKTAAVWISDVACVKDALKMMECIGEITGKKARAGQIVQQIRNDTSIIQQNFSAQPPIRTAYLIWKNPYMTIGGDTFINDIVKLAGWQNVFEDKMRYPETTIEEIKARQTELILLSSEPYPFNEKHIAEISLQLPGVSVKPVDGEIFSWYGSRMLRLKEYLNGFMATIREV